MARCTLTNIGFINADRSINFDVYSEFVKIEFRSEQCRRELYNKCTAITPRVNDCNQAWEVYVCLLNLTCFF